MCTAIVMAPRESRKQWRPTWFYTSFRSKTTSSQIVKRHGVSKHGPSARGLGQKLNSMKVWTLRLVLIAVCCRISGPGWRMSRLSYRKARNTMSLVMTDRLIRCALGGGRCAQHLPRPLAPEVQARWASDSSAYEARLAKYLRDSTVIDSIARTVNTDSLRKLYQSSPYRQGPSCRVQRGGLRDTSELAHVMVVFRVRSPIKRMTDTAVTSAKEKAGKGADRFGR